MYTDTLKSLKNLPQCSTPLPTVLSHFFSHTVLLQHILIYFYSFNSIRIDDITQP